MGRVLSLLQKPANIFTRPGSETGRRSNLEYYIIQCMGKRGPKPEGKVKIKWSSKFAYAIGLLVTDGCLYKDGRHISLTTKDLEQANNFKKCLNLNVKIGIKKSGKDKKNSCFHVQFGDVLFFKFLISIGLMPTKSKIIGQIKIPKKYFFDYLRGCFDGDGTFYSYWDSRWKSSHMFYIEFSTASKIHADWLRKKIHELINIKGFIASYNNGSFHHLKYAKKESIEIIKKMYNKKQSIFLSRKYIKIKKALDVEKKQQIQYK